MAVCRFSNTGDDWHVLVGVAKDLILNPRSVAGGFVYTYKLVNSGEKLEFLHKVRVFCGRRLPGVCVKWNLERFAYVEVDPSME